MWWCRQGCRLRYSSPFRSGDTTTPTRRRSSLRSSLFRGAFLGFGLRCSARLLAGFNTNADCSRVKCAQITSPNLAAARQSTKQLHCAHPRARVNGWLPRASVRFTPEVAFASGCCHSTDAPPAPYRSQGRAVAAKAAFFFRLRLQPCRRSAPRPRGSLLALPSPRRASLLLPVGSPLATLAAGVLASRARCRPAGAVSPVSAPRAGGGGLSSAVDLNTAVPAVNGSGKTLAVDNRRAPCRRRPPTLRRMARSWRRSPVSLCVPRALCAVARPPCGEWRARGALRPLLAALVVRP